MVGCVEGLVGRLPGSLAGEVRWIRVCGTEQSGKVSRLWTVLRAFWLTALRLDVSGVAVDVKLCHDSGRHLVRKYRIYRDPIPHPALRGRVVSKLIV